MEQHGVKYLVEYLVTYLAMTLLLTARAVDKQTCAQLSLRLRLRCVASMRPNIRSAVILAATTAYPYMQTKWFNRAISHQAYWKIIISYL